MSGGSLETNGSVGETRIYSAGPPGKEADHRGWRLSEGKTKGALPNKNQGQAVKKVSRANEEKIKENIAHFRTLRENLVHDGGRRWRADGVSDCFAPNVSSLGRVNFETSENVAFF